MFEEDPRWGTEAKGREDRFLSASLTDKETIGKDLFDYKDILTNGTF